MRKQKRQRQSLPKNYKFIPAKISNREDHILMQDHMDNGFSFTLIFTQSS